MTVKGGTGAIVEYFGDGVDSISCTGKKNLIRYAVLFFFIYFFKMALRGGGKELSSALVFYF